METFFIALGAVFGVSSPPAIQSLEVEKDDNGHCLEHRAGDG